MNACWKYIEEHHEQYGVALFVVPVLLCAFAATGVCYGLAQLFR